MSLNLSKSSWMMKIKWRSCFFKRFSTVWWCFYWKWRVYCNLPEDEAIWFEWWTHSCEGFLGYQTMAHEIGTKHSTGKTFGPRTNHLIIWREWFFLHYHRSLEGLLWGQIGFGWWCPTTICANLAIRHQKVVFEKIGDVLVFEKRSLWKEQ